MIGPIQEQIRAAFDVVELYWGSIPTYPAGTWSWTWASNGSRPGPVVDAARAEAIAADTNYWNPRLHEACFALPTFLRCAGEGDDPFARFGAAD